MVEELEEVYALKPSKKYANGTIHENATGKFQILDRYLDEDGKTILLKFQWLNTGKIEVNKEVNISASIWKFQKSRGFIESPKETEPLQEITLQEIYDRQEIILNHIETSVEDREEYQNYMITLHEKVSKQADSIEMLMTKLELAFSEIREINKKVELADKLIDKMP